KPLESDGGLLQHRYRAFGKLVGDVLVEPGLDDEDVRLDLARHHSAPRGSAIGRCPTTARPWPSRPTMVRWVLERRIMRRTPRSTRICAPTPYSRNVTDGLCPSSRRRTRSDRLVGKGSRISTTTPFPSSAMMRMAACNSPPLPLAQSPSTSSR